MINAGRDKKIEQILKDSRKMRNNKEYNQYTTIEEGNLIAPHYALTGKITQRNKTIKSDEYAERACEMGESLGCEFAFEWYRDGYNGIAKNPKMARYYKNKTCDMGYKDYCK